MEGSYRSGRKRTEVRGILSARRGRPSAHEFFTFSEQYPLEATMQVSSSKTGTLVLVFDYNAFSSLQDRPYHRAVRPAGFSFFPILFSLTCASYSALYLNLYDFSFRLSIVYPTNYADMCPYQRIATQLCQPFFSMTNTKFPLIHVSSQIKSSGWT